MGGFKRAINPQCRVAGVSTFLVLPALFAVPDVFAAESAIPTLDEIRQLAAASQAEDKIIPFEVTVNGAVSGTWLFVEHNGALYAPRDAFDEWRVTLTETADTITFREQTYYPLSAIYGFELKIDFANQSIEVLFSPGVFAETRLANRKALKPVLSEVLPSLFLNYDINYSKGFVPDAKSPQDMSALMEVGYSTGLGILTSSFLAQNLMNDKLFAETRALRRLETTFTRDFTDKNFTLRLGDAYTKSSMVGRSVYFGGISFGTNFGLTPGFISQPLPMMSGLSATPSTVELYIDDVLRQVSSVPTGPFTIDNFPTLTGSGNARVVVRDQLGRETVIEQSFVTDSQLLSKGLSDWSLEAGRVRNELGLEDSDYGPTFVGGFLRRGISDTLTLEAHGEAATGQSNFGLGAISGLPFMLLGRAAFNTSNHQQLGPGRQWLLGLEYQILRSSAVLDVQGASSNYRQLGQVTELQPSKLQIAGSWSYGSEKFGSFNLGLAKIARYDDEPIMTMTAGYSRLIGKQASVSVVASRAVGERLSTNNITLSVVVPLSRNRVASTYATQRKGQNSVYQTVTRNAGLDENLSWRVLGGRQPRISRLEGGAYYAGRYGTASADLSYNSEQTALRLGATSSLVFADGHLFATRRLEDSFAVAEIAGYDNIGIGLGSNVMTHTNKNGIALIPRLTPYQNNSIQLDPRELPISAGIVSIEQLAVPSYRSAVKVTFPVRGGRGALLRILLDDGDVAPIGALVHIEGDTEEFYVARRGEAFVSGLQEQSRLILVWQDQQCTFDVTLPPEEPDVIPRVGPFACPGLTR